MPIEDGVVRVGLASRYGARAGGHQRKQPCVALIYRHPAGRPVGQGRKSGAVLIPLARGAYSGMKKLRGWLRQRDQMAERMRARSTPLTLWACRARRNAK